MLKSKVNNWAVELETFNITFEHISGVKNTLADTPSRIVKVDPDIQSEPKQEGYEFGYSCFEELPPVEVFAVEEKVTKDVSLRPDKEIGILEFECTLPVPKRKLRHLQLKEEMCQKRASGYIWVQTALNRTTLTKMAFCGSYWKIMNKYSRQQCCQRYLSILYYSWLTVQWGTMGSNGSTCQLDGCIIGTT